MSVVIECPECGKNVSNLATKCPHCGKRIERAGGVPEYVPVRPSGGLAKKIVGLVVLLAIAAAVVYYVLPMFGIDIMP